MLYFIVTLVEHPELKHKMPKNCAAVGCTNHNMMAHKKLSFCIFPDKRKQPERWRKWVQALNRVNQDGSEWQPGGKYVYLCSEHFMTGKPNGDPDHPDYLPTVFNYKSDSTTGRKIQRLEKPWNEGQTSGGPFSSSETVPLAFQPKKLSSSISTNQDKILNSDPPYMITEPHKVSSLSRTSHVMGSGRFGTTGSNRTVMYDMVDSLKVDRVDLKRKVEGFEKQLAVSRYDSKSMRPDDDSWRYFTGLDSIIFQTFCTLIIAQLFSNDK